MYTSNLNSINFTSEYQWFCQVAHSWTNNVYIRRFQLVSLRHTHTPLVTEFICCIYIYIYVSCTLCGNHKPCSQINCWPRKQDAYGRVDFVRSRTKNKVDKLANQRSRPFVDQPPNWLVTGHSSTFHKPSNPPVKATSLLNCMVNEKCLKALANTIRLLPSAGGSCSKSRCVRQHDDALDCAPSTSWVLRDMSFTRARMVTQTRRMARWKNINKWNKDNDWRFTLMARNLANPFLLCVMWLFPTAFCIYIHYIMTHDVPYLMIWKTHGLVGPGHSHVFWRTAVLGFLQFAIGPWSGILDGLLTDDDSRQMANVWMAAGWSPEQPPQLCTERKRQVFEVPGAFLEVIVEVFFPPVCMEDLMVIQGVMLHFHDILYM